MADFGGLVTTDAAINAETRAPIVIAVAASFSFVTVTVVILRIYTRVCMIKFAGADDVAIVIAEIFALATAIGASMEAKHGLGKHTWTVSKDDKQIQLKWLYFVIIVYNLATNVVKLSFLLQYRRLFAGIWTTRVCKWGMIFIPLWAIVQIILLATACLPLASIVPSMKDKCLPATPIWLFSSATNIVTDFAILVIPLPSVIRLRVAGRKQRIMLSIVFGIGFFTCIISIIRIFTLTQRTKSKDIFWTGIYPAVWSIVEIHCGILCSCLTTLRPLLRRFIPWLGETKPSTDPYELNYIPRTDAKKQSRRAGVSEAATYPGSESVEALKENGTHYAAQYTPSEDATSCKNAYFERVQESSRDDVDEMHENEEAKSRKFHRDSCTLEYQNKV